MNIYLKTIPAFIATLMAFPQAWAQDVGAPTTPATVPLLEQAQAEPGVASAQATVLDPANPNKLQGSVVKGLQNSAMLDSDIHNLDALMEDANVRFGGLLPTVDIRGTAGRERSRIEGGESRTYNANSYGIEARQNLYSGFAGQSRYLAAFANAMEGYFRYLNRANQVAFEASGAHIDVSRFQALTALAEDNLNYHKQLMDRIAEKVQSGVSRQSDLEQARSRYTLALGNLATEKANAFSAMASYQRVTDAVWPVNEKGEYVITANFEVENPERIVFALNNHPLLMAANSTIEAAKREVTVASEGFHPRIDLRAKTDVYSNYLSTFDERQISTVDVVANMNLFRGGSDKAARSAAAKRHLRAMDDKLVVCRAIRQSAQTALFDVMSNQRKLTYFRQQAEAISKARAAYEQQFNVGRRSLLDLLSAENEYFQAQRALINVEADLSVSTLRLLAATGQLVTLFGVDELVKSDAPTRRQVILYKDNLGSGPHNEGCPAALISIDEFTLPALGFDEALKGVQAPTDMAPAQALEFAQLGNAQLPAAGPTPASLADPATVSKSLIERTNSWAKAWEQRDVNRYISYYAPTFKPEEGSYEDWVANRRDRLGSARNLNIRVSDFQVIPNFDDPDLYEVVFIQDYRAAHYQERSKKVLSWKSTNGMWQIIREQNLPENTVYAPTSKKGNLAEALPSKAPAATPAGVPPVDAALLDTPHLNASL